MDAGRDSGAGAYGENHGRLGFEMHIGLEKVFFFLNLN
jgi:hypothetical protein